MTTHSRSRHARRLLLLAAVWLLLTPLTVLAHSGGDGPPVLLDQVVPTVMEETATVPDDLDGDGADDLVVLSRDGVAQRYAADGTPLWSTSYVEIAHAMGLEPYRVNLPFWAEFDGLTSCGSARSVAFHDVDGDGTRDVFALLWLRTLDPNQARTAAVQLDGVTGEVLRAEPLEGRALAQTVGDLDGDGRFEHVVVREDGPPVDWRTGPEEDRSMIEGSGATATVRAVDVTTGELRWTFDTGATWPVVSGLVLTPRDQGSDVVVSLGGSNGGPRCTGSDVGAQTQRVVALAGVSGEVRWDTTVDGLGQDLLGLPDGGVVTWTDDGGGVVEVLEGADGSRRWRVGGLDGGGVLGAVSRAGGALAVLSARSSDHDEVESRLALLDVASGATVADVRLDTGGGELPSSADLRLAATGQEEGTDPVVVARTARTVSAVTGAGDLAWQQTSDGTARHVLVVTDPPDAPRVWTQGTFERTRTSADGLPISIGSIDTTDMYRLVARSAATGEADGSVPLLANVLGATRADVSGDGVPDRIFGGLGQALVATDGTAGDVMWRTDLRTPIIDVWSEDLDVDGSPDLLVEAPQQAMGIRGHDGAVLWSYTLEFPVLDGFAAGAGGAWRDAEVSDLTGDGVRDLVVGFRTGTDERWSPAGNGKVIVLDGTTGAEHWRTELPFFVKGVNAVAVGDVTGDGVPDVAAALDAIGDAVYYGVVLLDGTDGSQLWAVHEFTGGKRDTWGRDSVELVDHGGDGDLDVAVLTREFGDLFPQLRYAADVRIHDGASGAVLDSARVATPDIELNAVSALDTADFGPAGQLVVAYGRYFSEGIGHVLVHAYDPTDMSTRFAFGVPTDTSARDVVTGDLTGDGIAELVLPTTSGLFVVDGAAALDGERLVLARTEPHHPLKGVLVDADGDGVAELETLETPAGWPLQIGPEFINHTAGAVRSLGLLDLSP